MIDRRVVAALNVRTDAKALLQLSACLFSNCVETLSLFLYRINCFKVNMIQNNHVTLHIFKFSMSIWVKLYPGGEIQYYVLRILWLFQVWINALKEHIAYNTHYMDTGKLDHSGSTEQVPMVSMREAMQVPVYLSHCQTLRSRF